MFRCQSHVIGGEALATRGGGGAGPRAGERSPREAVKAPAGAWATQLPRV